MLINWSKPLRTVDGKYQAILLDREREKNEARPFLVWLVPNSRGATYTVTYPESGKYTQHHSPWDLENYTPQPEGLTSCPHCGMEIEVRLSVG